MRLKSKLQNGHRDTPNSSPFLLLSLIVLGCIEVPWPDQVELGEVQREAWRGLGGGWGCSWRGTGRGARGNGVLRWLGLLLLAGWDVNAVELSLRDFEALENGLVDGVVYGWTRGSCYLLISGDAELGRRITAKDLGGLLVLGEDCGPLVLFEDWWLFWSARLFIKQLRGAGNLKHASEIVGVLDLKTLRLERVKLLGLGVL